MQTTTLPISFHDFIDRQSAILPISFPYYVKKGIPDLTTQEDGVAAYMSFLIQASIIEGNIEALKIKEEDLEPDRPKKARWELRTHHALIKASTSASALDAWLLFCGVTEHKDSDVEKYRDARKHLAYVKLEEQAFFDDEILALKREVYKLSQLLEPVKSQKNAQKKLFVYVLEHLAGKLFRGLADERAARIAQVASVDCEIRQIRQELIALGVLDCDWTIKSDPKVRRDKIVTEAHEQAASWRQKSISKFSEFLQTKTGIVLGESEQ